MTAAIRRLFLLTFDAMNRGAVILSALCLTAFSPPAFANDLRDAKAALERSDYERALKLLDDALKTMPKGQAAVYEMRAVTQAHRGRPMKRWPITIRPSGWRRASSRTFFAELRSACCPLCSPTIRNLSGERP